MATPVRVKNLERLWSLRIPNAGMIAMGIRRKLNSECVGVLVPVNDEELAQFDLRELGYERVPVEHHEVERIASLDEQIHYNHDHSFYRQPAMIWVYVQEQPEPVSVGYPIVQSYLDVVLRGCMTISPDFAKDFLQTTKGWHPDDFDHPDHNTEHQQQQRPEQVKDTTTGFWLNDRHAPRYNRADVEYSKTMGEYLDRLLHEHRPEMSSRKHLDENVPTD